MSLEILEKEFEEQVKKIADVSGLSREKIIAILDSSEYMSDLMDRITELM